MIGGPSTDTESKFELTAGTTSLLIAKGVAFTDEGQCMTDVFSVTNPGGTAPPRICGTNSGEHCEYSLSLPLINTWKYLCFSFHPLVYVDASDACNELNFDLGVASAGVGRQWNIKVHNYCFHKV